MTFARGVLLLGMAVATVLTFVLPPAKGFREPDLARIIFFHLPCAFMTSGLVFLAAWQGIQVLRPRSPQLDVRHAATVELGALFGALTMATGILFSKVQWGTWWQSDPRQTSFLMVLLILAVGLILRAAIGDERRRAAVSASYSVAALVPAIYLIFVYPRLPHITKESFHPSNTIAQGGFDSAYRLGLISVFAMLVGLAVLLYRMRVRVGQLELQWEVTNGNVDDFGHGAADSRLVRPVSVRPERGP